MGRRGGLPMHCRVLVHLMMIMILGGRKLMATGVLRVKEPNENWQEKLRLMRGVEPHHCR